MTAQPAQAARYWLTEKGAAVVGAPVDPRDAEIARLRVRIAELEEDLAARVPGESRQPTADRHSTTCDLLVGRGLRACSCRPAGDPGAVIEADPYGRSADA